MNGPGQKLEVERKPNLGLGSFTLEVRLRANRPQRYELYRVQRFLQAWQIVGVAGAFGGKGVDIWFELIDEFGGRLVADVDTGSAGETALKAMLLGLEGLLNDGVHIERVVVGEDKEPRYPRAVTNDDV